MIYPIAKTAIRQMLSKEIIMRILIFKTNIKFKKDLKKIETHLNNFSSISKWNIDRADIDNVLRIETINLNEEDIIRIIIDEGFKCEALKD